MRNTAKRFADAALSDIEPVRPLAAKPPSFGGLFLDRSGAFQ